MLTGQRIRRALVNLRGRPYKGVVCRVVYAAALYRFQEPGFVPRPLYNLGPPSNGARFTPKGGARSIYFAEDYQTAWNEFLQIAGGTPLRPQIDKKAFVTFSGEVNLRNIIDLTQSETQTTLKTTTAELCSPWRYRNSKIKAPTHVLGAEVTRNGRFDGLRFPSSKGDGACLVIFCDLIRPPAYVRICDPKSNLLESIP